MALATLVGATLLALPASASAASIVGAGTDATADNVGGGSSADIVAFGAGYDAATGVIAGQVKVAAPLPSSSSAFAFVFLGVTQPDGSCRTLVGTGDTLGLSGSSPTWGTPADPTGGGPARRLPSDATTISLSASAPALAGQPYDCAFASTSTRSGMLDGTDPVALRPPASDPPPNPPAPQPPATPTPAPQPRAAARLELSVAAPAPLRRNRWTPLTITLANSGTAAASGTRLRLRLPRGVRAKPAGARSLGTLAAGARRTLRLRVQLTRRARERSKVELAASAGGGAATARQSVELRLQRRVAELQLAVAGVTPVARGRSLTVRVAVRNGGIVAARRARLRIGGRGVSASPSVRTLGTLAAGARRSVKVRLTRARRGGAAVVRFRLTAARSRAAAQTVRLADPPPRATPQPPARRANDLGQLVFLRYIPGTTGISQDQRTGYAFSAPGWVYRGNPEGGIPDCRSRTAGVDADGDPTDGCLPYTYDAAANRLTIDGQPVALNAAKTELTVGEETFLLKQTLAPGARLSVSLKNIEVYGLFPNQSVFTSWITLTQDGQFAFSGSAIGSLGAGSPSTISSTIAPDRRGTYEILPGSAIQFSYADGRVSRRTILIDGTPGDPSVRLDPQREGLLLDGTSYWSS